MTTSYTQLTRDERAILGQRLRECRLKHQWSQTEAEDRANVPRSQIGKLETGHYRYPSMPTILRLADLYEESLDWLMGRDAYIADRLLTMHNAIHEVE